MNAENSTRPSQRPLVWHYHQGTIAVTSRYFDNGIDRFAIPELTDLMRARGAAHPGTTISIVIAVVQAPLLVPVLGLARAPVAWALAFVMLVIPCFVAFFCAKRWPPQQQLLARYRGREVTLFVSRDEREFGQVARAVGRAVESAASRVM